MSGGKKGASLTCTVTCYCGETEEEVDDGNMERRKKDQ